MRYEKAAADRGGGATARRHAKDDPPLPKDRAAGRTRAQRANYLTLTIPLGVLLLIEAGAFVLIIAVLVHLLWLKLLLEGLMEAVHLFVMVMLLAPLWTKHRLSQTHLRLHYGLVLNVSIPRAAIASAQPVHEKLSGLQAMSAQYDAKKRHIIACFSEQGQVLLHLHQPLALKVGRTAHPTETILINVDRRDEFLGRIAPLLAAAK